MHQLRPFTTKVSLLTLCKKNNLLTRPSQLTLSVKRSLQHVKTISKTCPHGRRVTTAPHCHLTVFQRCKFHTSPRHDVHPLIWVVVKPFMKISAALTGRGLRKWYRRMDHKEKRDFWTYLRERWHVLAGAVTGLVGLFGVYYWSHIQETPITGRKRFVALTHDQIISIAQSQAQALIEANKDKIFPADSIQANKVMMVALRLLKANPELQNMNFEKWTVYVIKDPLINACVLPSGDVFVYEGMLDIARTPSELAIILGHEMAHALLEHGIEELSYSQLVDYVVIVLMAALWCVIPSDGIALVTQWFHNKLVNILTHLPHSRAIEEEADRVGAMLAAKACYDIRYGTVLWQKMEANEKLTSAEPVPTFLSTHPHNLKRADFFDFVIPQSKVWSEQAQCPTWSDKDPREVIEHISKFVDNHTAAVKANQNLKKVTKTNIPTIKKAE